MLRGLFVGSFGLLTLAAIGLGLTASACSDDAASACTEATYNCNGTVLQQCNSGAFVDLEDCTGKGTCMASMGHCHPSGGEGGHGEGGHGEGGHGEGGHGGAGGSD